VTDCWVRCLARALVVVLLLLLLAVTRMCHCVCALAVLLARVGLLQMKVPGQRLLRQRGRPMRLRLRLLLSWTTEGPRWWQG